MGMFKRAAVLVTVPVIAALAVGCTLLGGADKDLAKEIEKIDGIIDVRVLERSEEGLGDKYLDVTCTFDSGLSAQKLGDAITRVNGLADASEIKVSRNRLVFGEHREYQAESGLLDPGTGILQAVEPLQAYLLEPSSLRENSDKASGYRVTVHSQADELGLFGADVTAALDAMGDHQRSDLVQEVRVRAEGSGFQKRGFFSFSTVGPMDQATTDLFAKAVANPDPKVVGMMFSVAPGEKPLVRLVTDGTPSEVADFLQNLAADSPLDVTVEAIEADTHRPWFSQVG